AWGLTALVAASNGAAAAAALRRRAGRPWGRTLLPLAAPAALAAAFLVYGAVRLPSLPSRDGPVVLLVQGNVPQGEKRRQFGEVNVAEEILRRHLELTRRGLEAHPEVDVVVWPETMYPAVIRDAERIDDAP